MCGLAHLYGVCRGPACVLERLLKTFACFVSHRIVSREQRARENQLQSDQQEDWQPHQIPESGCGDRDEVDSSDIIKGYEVGKGQYIEIQPEELEAIAIESKRTIEIDEFVPKKEIDELYLNSPYYLAPDGDVGQQALAVIREAIRKEGMVALGRVVFTSREHVIALEPRGKGLLGITLRYPYEVRKEGEYFDDIPDEKIPKDMLELASHIVETKSGHFEPEKFEDQYEDALKELLKKNRLGRRSRHLKSAHQRKSSILMDALRRSVETERGGSAKRQAPSVKARGSESERPKKKKSR